MKLFTIEEANELIPMLRPKLEQIRAQYLSLAVYRDNAKLAAAAANDSGGGGMAGGTAYVNRLYEVGRIATELHETGIQLKDYSRGLIDFPSLKEGRVVLLCWQLDDADELEWWHELEGGFAGRQPL
ncbi:MAG: DUF2203 domain-containing protein [Acidobacteria bacterium]|nr:DUF2203 domain-containing protein [Acidobacteriota bacterium]MBK8151449.1 DUF2203 domain-containing protein [Acidobacteriota bacterium]MBK8812679.1 DUF2203 domain-containing protein [Acidobacteriota bacterium]